MPELVELFSEKGVSKILDLGCGSGRHVIYLSKHGFDVYGFDVAHRDKTSKKLVKERESKS